MYEWPPLDELAFLVGYQVNAVRISSWPVDLYLAKPRLSIVITLEKPVHVRFADGLVTENEHLPDTGIRLVAIIGKYVTSVERTSEHCLVLNLDRVSITLDVKCHTGECFSIVGDGRHIVV